MPHSLSSLAQALGLPLQIRLGNAPLDDKRAIADTVVEGIAPLESASSSEVTFLANPKLMTALKNTQALAVILRPESAEACPVSCLISDNPYLSYAKLSQLFSRYQPAQPSIHPSAVIADSAILGEGVYVGPGVVIGEQTRVGDDTQINANTVIDQRVTIGSGVTLYSNVSIGRDVMIGDDVVVQANTVIGGEGFGFAPHVDAVSGNLHWQPIAQLGTVRIGNRVQIGANTTIDRGALDDTIVGDDVIIDNLVQVAHNVEIGQGTAIAGCVGIAGSAKIGKRCSIGGGAGISGHLSIADGTTVFGMTLINKSVTQSGQYASGTGMQPVANWRKSAVRFTQLDNMASRIKSLESELRAIKHQLGADVPQGDD